MTAALSGRCAVVTGAGQGVGRGIARALAGAGANLLLAQRRATEGEREADFLRTTYGVEAIFAATDVTQRDQVERMVQTAHSRFGRLDILVNNAGSSFAKRLENHTDEDMRGSLDLNFWGVFWAMRAVFPLMKEQGYGRIINIASLNGVNAHMFTAAYNASKEAVRALSRTAAVEWGPHGITVNVICPAASSPQAQEYFAANPEMLQTILQQIPAGRLGDAQEDIGPIATFLASEGSGYINGNTVFADGGSHVNGVTWRPAVAV